MQMQTTNNNQMYRAAGTHIFSSTLALQIHKSMHLIKYLSMHVFLHESIKPAGERFHPKLLQPLQV